MNRIIYTCLDRDVLANADFSPQLLGYYWHHGQVVIRPKGIARYFFLLVNCDLEVLVDGRIERCPANTLVVFPPNVELYYGENRHWEHSILSAGGTVTEALIRDNDIPLQQMIPLADASFVYRAVKEMHREITTYHPCDLQILQNSFHTMILELARFCRSTDKETRVPDDFVRIKTYIETHYQQNLRLDDLAKMACLSPQYFHEKFKQYFHVSPNQHLIQTRMDSAAELLGDINLSIEQVSDQVGINSKYYFSRLFKKHFGVPPSTYRNKTA